MVKIDISEIKNSVKNNINSKKIANLIIAIMEKTESSETRLELLEFISEFDLSYTSYFELFENYLVSDAQEEIRALAAKIILQYYLVEGFNALEWTILNDSSSLVLKEIYYLTKESDNAYLVMLESTIKERLNIIAQKYKIIIDEVPFLLDLGIKIMESNFFIGNQDFHFIYENDILCIIKERHIIELGIAFIKDVPESIGALNKLEHLDLSFSYISILPNSMKNLTNLKSINLSCNEFNRVPDVLKFLKSVESINLTHNKINFVPNWIKKIKNLKF